MSLPKSAVPHRLKVMHMYRGGRKLEMREPEGPV